MKKRILNSVGAVIIFIAVIGTILASIFIGLYFGGDKPDLEQTRFVGYIMHQSYSSYEDLDKMGIDKYTHLIYVSAKVSKVEMVPSFFDPETQQEQADSKELRMLSSYLKNKYPKTKLMVTFGNGDFCSMSKTDNGRTKFAEGCKGWMNEYGLDGFDIDWEYPDLNGCDTCCKDHAKLMAQLRETLGRDAVISVAVSSWGPRINRLKVSSLNKSLSFVNVMTYDFDMDNHASYDKTRNSMYSAYLVGFDKEKLNIGLAYYSRCATEGQDYWNYKDVMNAVDKGVLKLEKTRNSGIAYNDFMRHSFDTPETVYKKARLVRTCGYGGVFCWTLAGDRNCELINSAYEAIA